VDGSQEISGKFVVASCDTPEILEPTETAHDNVAPFVDAFAEAVEGYPVGFVWNDRLRAPIDDFGAKAVAIVAFVPMRVDMGGPNFKRAAPAAISASWPGAR